MSKKSWPILNTSLQYKIGQDFLDIQHYGNKITESAKLLVTQASTVKD